MGGSPHPGTTRAAPGVEVPPDRELEPGIAEPAIVVPAVDASRQPAAMLPRLAPERQPVLSGRLRDELGALERQMERHRVAAEHERGPHQ